MKGLRVLWQGLCGLLVASVVATWAGVAAEIHVWGTDTYPADELAVQAALDAIEPGGTVVLHGTFNFGTTPGPAPDFEMGGVKVWKPNVTLVGNDALIHGGGKMVFGPSANKAIVGVGAAGVTVRNIVFDGTPLPTPSTAPYLKSAVMVQGDASSPTDDPIIIERNEMSTVHRGVLVRWTQCMTIARENTVYSNHIGIFAFSNPGPLRFVCNDVEMRNPMGMGIGAQECESEITVGWNSIWGLHHRGIVTYLNTGPVTIVGNDVADYGMLGIVPNETGETNVVVADNTLRPSPFGPSTLNIYALLNSCPVTITRNSIHESAPAGRGAFEAGILVLAVPVGMGLDQDNPPVLVTGNCIDMHIEDGPSDYSVGISIGNSTGAFTSNTLVAGNTLTGTLATGLIIGPYGEKNVLAGNRLSALTTWDAQIAAMGGKNCLIKGNVLGPANSGMHPDGVALLLTSDRIFSGAPMPGPTEKNIIMGNDYRLTGLPGWSDGLEGDDFGCIAIYSMADLLEDAEMGTEVRYNFIKETTKFPAGTSPREQIFKWTESGLVHDNTIWKVTHPFICSGRLLAKLRDKVQRVHDLLSRFECFGEGLGQELGKLALQDDLDTGPAEEVRVPETATSHERAVPHSYELVGNYPNPFNPSTVIRYALPVAGSVRLEVYNLLGERVALLVDEHQSAGFHEAVFTDPGWASGVYIYRLTAGDFTATKKLMLLK